MSGPLDPSISSITNKQAWWQFIVEWKAGFIILAIKYKVTLDKAKEMVNIKGGLEKMAQDYPWVFDYLRETPLKGYDRGI